MKHIITVLSLIATANIVLAQPQTSGVKVSQTQYEISSLQQSEYAKLAEAQQTAIAHTWGITPKDYSHYLWLMQYTENGVYYTSQHLDPTWILAINAKDEEERKRFTVQAIKNERARIEKLLVFEHEFNRLQKELYPNDKPIATPFAKAMSQASSKNVLQANDMLLLFTDINTEDKAITRLIGITEQSIAIKLNIYITGEKITDEAIQQWALQRQIPIDLVRKGLITLNHDNGRFAKLTQGKAKLPFVVISRNGSFKAIDIKSL